MHSLRIALTAGEPAGIGPDIILQIAQQEWPVELVVIADYKMLQERAALLNLPVQFKEYCKTEHQLHRAGELTVLHVPLASTVQAGQLNTANVPYVLKTLELAGKGCMTKEFAAIVTAPVHKGIINDAGISFTGHTEFFAELTHTLEVVMLLAAGDLRVALATTHLPLKDVPAAITCDSLEKTISILHKDLQQKFKIAKPKILVCGLNPHAGESGHLGIEEITVINPTLDKLRKQGMDLLGALPADTIFTPYYLQQADAVLAMYHDQGLPVLKHAGFGHAVNITLGLPITRTSVDHGTALDLAGTGKASSGSLYAAIQLAIEIGKGS